MAKALEDYRAAGLRPPMVAMLAFVEKMVRDPDSLTPADGQAVRDLGVPDEGLRTAILVVAGFTTITKIADTFEFAIQSDAAFKADARMLLKRGYVM